MDKKLSFFLPNIFTALNMACGFVAIMLSLNGKYYEACLLLFLGAIFDCVDGRLARMMGSQSSFGEQFDSMSDLISFCMAPALLFHQRFLQGFDRIGIIISFLFLLCGALRLARFNANIGVVKKDYFQGLPSPSAAMALVGYILLSTEVGLLRSYPIVALFYIAFYAFLMVSNLPFYSFKNSEWVRRHKRLVLLIIFIMLAATLIYEQITVFAGITAYVVISLIVYLFRYRQFKEVVVWDEREED